MHTNHTVYAADARVMPFVDDESVALVVTSPPYPMVEMWDGAFGAMSGQAEALLAAEDGLGAFEAMHQELDRVWAECLRVLVPGGFACINVGDATRTVAGDFRLYHNHARILAACAALGFTVLPDILWRKPTNAPNKFMGSGMLPAGAYVTYEHEYVLVLRKGGKRSFASAPERANRQRSAFFWEERNTWFSDVWMDLRGASQRIDPSADRSRSGAFPFELPYRLINMYSVYGDTVLDPFVGTGTTLLAAIAAARSSVGVEVSEPLAAAARKRLHEGALPAGRSAVAERLEAHARFVRQRLDSGKPLKHANAPHQVPVITGQERTLELLQPEHMAQSADGQGIRVTHARPAAAATGQEQPAWPPVEHAAASPAKVRQLSLL